MYICIHIVKHVLITRFYMITSACNASKNHKNETKSNKIHNINIFSHI